MLHYQPPDHNQMLLILLLFGLTEIEASNQQPLSFNLLCTRIPLINPIPTYPLFCQPDIITLMQTYSGIHQSISLLKLISNPNTLEHIIHTTRKIGEQVDLQAEISIKMYTLYTNLSSMIERLCQKCEAKYPPSSSTNTVVCKQFIKTVQLAFHNLYQISFKHQIDLKTIVKREKEESWMQSIGEKLDRLKDATETYLGIFKLYEEREKEYLKRCRRFTGLETNTVVYYSLHLLNPDINEIIELELEMQKILLKLQSEHSYLQILYKQTYKLLSVLLTCKLKKVYDIVGLIRQTLLKLFSFEDVIVEEGSKDYLTNLSEENMDENFNIESPKGAIQAAKRILCHGRMVRETFQEFLKDSIGIFESYNKSTKQSNWKKMILNFERQKNLIEENLGCKIYSQATDTTLLIKIFEQFVEEIVYQLNSHQNLSKYKTMDEKLFNRLEKQLESFSHHLPNGETIMDNSQLYNYYLRVTSVLEKKYSREAEDINSSFRSQVLLITKEFKNILSQFHDQFQNHQYQKSSSNKLDTFVKQILSSHQYNIFRVPFILNPPEYKFIRSPQIDSLLKLKSEINNPIDISVDLSERVESSSQGCTGSFGCCGATSNKSNLIDKFNCALVNTILLQGKLKFYKKEIKFKSMFNKESLIGKTELKIPVKDITSIEKDKKSINGIVIHTLHGALVFSSFITSPIPLILKSYSFHKPQSQPIKQFDNLESLSDIQNRTVIGDKKPNLKDTIINRLIYLGFSLESPNRYQKESFNMVQRATIEENINEVVVKMEYNPNDNHPEMYRFIVCCKEDGRIDVKYSLRDSPNKECKDLFLDFIKCFMAKEDAHVQNTRSEIFNLSSIDDWEGPEQKQIQKPLTDVSINVQNTSKQETNKVIPSEAVRRQQQLTIQPTNKRLTNTRDSKSGHRGSKSAETPAHCSPNTLYFIILIVAILVLLL